MLLYSSSIGIVKQKVVQSKQLHNNTEGQSEANLTSMTVSSHPHELENSGVEDCDTTSNPPPVGSGLEAGA